MPQPLDPAVQAMLERMPEPFAIPDPRPPLPVLAQTLRARPTPLPPPPAFDGTVEQRTVPVRWGSVPARLYRPSGAGDRPPVVAFFHGGGFVLGDLDSHEGLCRELATAARALLLSVDYRLAPEHPFPAGLEDAYDATAWLAGAAAELGGDPGRLGVAGDSAGGNLATATAMLAKAQGGPAIAFQLLFYPKLDFVNEYPSYAEAHEHGIPRGMSWFFDDCYLPDRARRADPLASPVLASDLAGMPPGLIVSADADKLRDEAEVYGQALRSAGVSVATLRAVGQMHGFATITEAVPSALLIVRAAAALMGDALRRRP
ncbi:MAG TPA: alpha/beta hydrolase [Roseiflexaceae bacterium]|nr:alpha/beta hydrolase [Roseiflexaceae bacterium]